MALFSNSWTLDFFMLFISILTLLYWVVKRKHSYWERKGVKSYPNPNLLFGHFGPIFTQKMNVGELMSHISKSTTEPFIGIYGLFWPILVLCDPQTIRNILITDFNHFTDRGFHCNEDYDPFSGNIAALPGEKWRNLRRKLSPAFASGKLKAMFSTLVECGASLQNHLEQLSVKGETVDVQEIAASYTTDVIASVAFGIEVDSIKEPNNDFRICGRKMLESSFMQSVRLALNFLAPKLMTFFRIKFVDESIERFIFKVVKENLDHREKNNVTRKDLFQLLIQLRNSGTVQQDDEWETVIKSDESQKLLSLTELTAQAFIFFEGGFETTSTTLTFLMYELGKNPEIQAKVHEEIDQVLQKHKGELTYESISEMKYVEACVNETLRKYPIVTILNRKCVKNYKIPGTDKVIEEGTNIFIPVLGLQMDERYYVEPENFKPERFIDGTGKLFLPFGDGPRNCIAMNMGKLETKVGIVLLLSNYKYELESSRDMVFDPTHFILVPKDRVKLRVMKRLKMRS